jgi:hypothetical protein
VIIIQENNLEKKLEKNFKEKKDIKIIFKKSKGKKTCILVTKYVIIIEVYCI